MKQLFYITVILCLFAIDVNAQIAGAPGGSITFDTNGSGGQLGHLQSGLYGSVSGNSQWIGIGQPSFGPAAYGMRIQDGSRFCTLDILNGNSEIFWGGSNSDLNFNYAVNSTTSPIQRMSIRNNGRVIVGDLNNVGAANARAALTVVETSASGGSGIDINATTNRNPNLLFSINNVVKGNIRILDNAGDRMEFMMGTAASTTAMTILQNRNVGIGTVNPTCKLEVNGDACISGSLSVASDRRFKKDINKLKNPMDLLEGLNGMSYEYNQTAFPEKEFTKGKTIGFIAQDFEKDLPELIRKDGEGYYAVNYLGVIPILVEAMKDLNTENETLKATNDNLANELAELKTLVNGLIQAQDANNNAKTIEQSLNNSINSKNVLFQNSPNPSDGNTQITYEVKAGTNVNIVITDTNGAEMTRFDNLPIGKQSVDLNGNFNNGIYLYTLYVDGVEVDTKRLVISK